MVSSVDALGRPCKAWILAVSWRMDGRHKLASLKPACCKPGVRSKYWLSPIFLVEWMWMAKEHWHWMIPSERIRKCGLQSENFKFVGKLLTFHRFILGLLYNSLNSGDITSSFSCPPATERILYCMCSLFSIYCCRQNCDILLVMRPTAHKNKYCLGVWFFCSFLEDFHSFRFYYGIIFQETFL